MQSRFIYLGACPFEGYKPELKSWSFPGVYGKNSAAERAVAKSASESALEAIRAGIETRGMVARCIKISLDVVVAVWLLQNPHVAFTPYVEDMVKEVGDVTRGSKQTSEVVNKASTIIGGQGMPMSIIQKTTDMLDCWYSETEAKLVKAAGKRKRPRKKMLVIPAVGKARWCRVDTIEQAYAMGAMAIVTARKGKDGSVRYAIRKRSEHATFDLPKFAAVLNSNEPGWKSRGLRVTQLPMKKKDGEGLYSTLDRDKIAALATEVIDNTKTVWEWNHGLYGSIVRDYTVDAEDRELLGGG